MAAAAGGGGGGGGGGGQPTYMLGLTPLLLLSMGIFFIISWTMDYNLVELVLFWMDLIYWRRMAH